MATICLCMIVKDEAHIMKRCLDRVSPLIDHWSIVDTGSTDGTQDTIRGILKDIPGELHERPWKNFGHNRSEALALARDKADYTLMLDADDNFCFENPDRQGFKAGLNKDVYFLRMICGSKYHLPKLTKNTTEWMYMGVLHEYLQCPTPDAKPITEYLPDWIRIEAIQDSARNKDPKKYEKDAKLLEQGLKAEPNNSRYWFYMAQCKRDAGNFVGALQGYEKRVKMGGWGEELYVAWWNVAALRQRLKKPSEQIVSALLEAHGHAPKRAEVLHDLARVYRFENKFNQAYLFAKAATDLVKAGAPTESLFLDPNIYAYGAYDELAVSAFWVGRYQECVEACDRLLAEPRLPPEHAERIKTNRNFAVEKMKG